MNRRRFLRAVGAGAAASSAGCLGFRVVEEREVARREQELDDLEDELQEQEDRSESLQRTVSAKQETIDRQQETIADQRSTIDRQQETITDLQGSVDYRPEVLFVNLVSRWDGYGDAEDNAIESTDQGELVVAYRWDARTADDHIRTLGIIDIYDEYGDRVSQNTHRTDETGDVDGLWETYMSFDGDAWSSGRYTAVVEIVDELNDAVSKPAQVTFEVY